MDKSLPKLAVLYADISGSTRLYEQYGDIMARADMSACIALLARISTGIGGKTLKTIGDEIMCAFEEPVKAALAAAEMQAGLRKACDENAFQIGRLHIKIGWHWGAVSWRGDELIGEAPVTAQQVINRAQADEILTSRQSIDELPPAMFQNVHMIDRVKADAFEGNLDICKMPWEQSGEETQIAQVPVSALNNSDLSLVLQHNDQEFRVNAAQSSCTIGRGRQADLRVNGGFTSRQHAEITFRNGRFNLRDESVNGTIIVDEHGTSKRLRREEGVISGSGRIGFGAAPDDDPSGTVTFRCE